MGPEVTPPEVALVLGLYGLATRLASWRAYPTVEALTMLFSTTLSDRCRARMAPAVETIDVKILPILISFQASIESSWRLVAVLVKAPLD